MGTGSMDRISSQYIQAGLFLLGLTFYWFLIMHTIFTTPVWFNNTSLHGTFTWLIMPLSNTLALSLGVIAYPLFSPFARHRFLVWAAALITGFGVALVFPGLLRPENIGISYFGAFLTGVGSAVIPLLWREISVRMLSDQIHKGIFALSVVFATLIYLVSISLPLLLAFCLAALSPILSVLFFMSANSDNHSTGMTEPVDEAQSASKGKKKFAVYEKGRVEGSAKKGLPIPLLCSCFIFALPQGIFRSNFLDYSVEIGDSWPLLFALSILVLCLTTVLTYLSYAKLRNSLLSAYCTPTILLLCLGLPFFIKASLLVNILIFVAHFQFLVYMYGELDVTTARRFSASQVVGLGVIFINLGLMSGVALGIFFEDFSFKWLVGLVWSILCLVALLFHYSVFQAPISGYLSVSGVRGKGVEQVQIFMTAPKERLFGPLDNQCAHLAKLYSLSSREEEILCLLARGKTAQSIADETSISFNTAKTHIAHIYQKMGIHTRQEVMNLIENSVDAFLI
jgi:DNA-binding CsgD family transcriptional regulator